MFLPLIMIQMKRKILWKLSTNGSAATNITKSFSIKKKKNCFSEFQTLKQFFFQTYEACAASLNSFSYSSMPIS